MNSTFQGTSEQPRKYRRVLISHIQGGGGLAAKSCPIHCSLPGSSVHGILQARILEWVAISFSRDLPNPGIEPRSPVLQADDLPTEL